MVDLYTWGTPHGRKVSIMLEELDLEYNVHEINIGKGEQHHPDFLAISPNNKFPSLLTAMVPAVNRSTYSNRAPSLFTWLKRPAASYCPAIRANTSSPCSS